MQNTTKHIDGPEFGSEKVATFADSLAALADDLREADVVSQEIQDLAAMLSTHASQMSDDVAQANIVATPTLGSFAKSAIGRIAAVAATLVIGTGGLGVAGALPAPIQDAFDATVQAIEATVFGDGSETAPASSTSQPSSSSRSSGRVSVARGPVPSESQATTPTPDLDDPQSEEDPSVGDERRSPTAASVAAVIATYDKETSEVSLGKLVSAAASNGKAGGAASVTTGTAQAYPKVRVTSKAKKIAAAAAGPSEVPSATEQLP